MDHLFFLTIFIFFLFQSSAPTNGSPGAPPLLGPSPIAGSNTTTYVAVSSAGTLPTTRQPFPNTQYGPPPGAPILQSSPTAATGSGSGSHTPTPSSHGPSPTPSSGSGCGNGGPWISSPSSHPPGYPTGDRRPRDPTHDRLIKKTRARQQQHPAVTPPVSPAKRGGRGEKKSNFLKFQIYLAFKMI